MMAFSSPARNLNQTRQSIRKPVVGPAANCSCDVKAAANGHGSTGEQRAAEGAALLGQLPRHALVHARGQRGRNARRRRALRDPAATGGRLYTRGPHRTAQTPPDDQAVLVSFLSSIRPHPTRNRPPPPVCPSIHGRRSDALTHTSHLAFRCLPRARPRRRRCRTASTISGRSAVGRLVARRHARARGEGAPCSPCPLQRSVRLRRVPRYQALPAFLARPNAAELIRLGPVPQLCHPTQKPALSPPRTGAASLSFWLCFAVSALP